MQQYWFVLMLLVVAFSSIAHGRIFGAKRDFLTSPLGKADAVRQMDNNNLNFDNIVTSRTPSSAVQDWSLVCQQLCGAALGGAVCAPYCTNLPLLPFEVQLENAKEIMDSKQNLLCPELCELQLGDDVCTCKNYITNDFDASMKDKQETNICAIICDHNSVTLTGCTPCGRDKNKEDMILDNLKSMLQQKVVPLEAATSDTPNWSELCAALCKTGDGGSLCNCDLSPFKRLT